MKRMMSVLRPIGLVRCAGYPCRVWMLNWELVAPPLFLLATLTSFHTVLLFQFLAIHGFRSWSRWLLEPLVRKYLGQDERLKRRVETFSLVSVQLTLCVLSAWFAWRILSPQPWIWKSSEWIPQEEDLIVAPDLKFYCLFFTATLFSDLLSLKKTNKDDTWFYAVHHVVCIALVLGSAMTGYSRICCVLVVFIDWANVFRLASILCHYLSTQHDDGYQFVANRFFEVHGILFFVTRNALLSIVAWIFITKTDASVTLKAFYALLVLLQAFRMVCIVQTLLNRYLGKGTANDMFISDMEDKQGLEEHKRMVLKKRGKRKIHWLITAVMYWGNTRVHA